MTVNVDILYHIQSLKHSGKGSSDMPFTGLGCRPGSANRDPSLLTPDDANTYRQWTVSKVTVIFIVIYHHQLALSML